MSLPLKNLVVLVTSADSKNLRFGTAFVICSEEGATYLLTCSHVVRDVGGDGQVVVGDKPATVAADGGARNSDLAVLRVDAPLAQPTLKLSATGQEGSSFQTAGYQSLKGQFLVQPLSGSLGKEVGIQSRGQPSSDRAWQLEIESDSKLEPGYSGSPILDDTAEVALGIVSHRKDEGAIGWALSVEALLQVWPGMPAGLVTMPHLDPAELTAILRKPRMNLDSEIETFQQIVAGQEAQAQLILVSGPTGMGKTWLLDTYEGIAQIFGFEILRILLGQQASIQNILDKVVFHLDPQHFAHYDECLTRHRPDTLTIESEKDWYRTLTRKLSMDLAAHPHPPQLLVLFDQLEKADRGLKEWLGQVLLPAILSIEYLAVVVAGQEEIDPKPRTAGVFYLKGVSLDCYNKYAADRGVFIDQNMTQELHKALHGEPKRFKEYIDGKASAGGVR